MRRIGPCRDPHAQSMPGTAQPADAMIARRHDLRISVPDLGRPRASAHKRRDAIGSPTRATLACTCFCPLMLNYALCLGTMRDRIMVRFVRLSLFLRSAAAQHIADEHAEHPDHDHRHDRRCSMPPRASGGGARELR
jgi:hypothetical protein